MSQWEGEFLRAVARRYDRMVLFGVDLSQASSRQQLSIAYISLALQKDEPSGEESIVGEKQVAEKVLAENPRLILKGDAGQGKTTLLQWMAVMCGEEKQKPGVSPEKGNEIPGRKTEERKIPFLIRLREFVEKPLPSYDRIPSLMLPHIPFAEEHRQWAKNKLDGGEVIVMVDGLDEIPRERREEVRLWLESMCGEFPQNRFILTSRPAALEELILLTKLSRNF